MAHTVRSISPVDLAAMTDRAAQHGISYASAGVDIEAGDRAVELFKPLASKATRPEVRGGLGGFAGLFALRNGGIVEEGTPWKILRSPEADYTKKLLAAIPGKRLHT